MANEVALNMEYFNENIGGKNLNKKYHQTIGKESVIVKGRCYMNYISSNDFYYKPFIKKRYMFDNDKKKIMFNKLNINNYKYIETDKEKINSKNSEVEIMKRMLTILSKNHQANITMSSKNKTLKNLRNMNSKYTTFMKGVKNKISDINTNTIGESFRGYSLPKIKKRNENIKEDNNRRRRNKTFSDENNNLFRTSTLNNNNLEKNINENNENETINNIVKNNTIKREKNKDYSPFLGKSMIGIYKKLEDRENKSLKNGEYITNGIDEINRRKFINSYDYKYKKFKINPKKIEEKKYCLISLFKNLGKIKDKKEIEDILFNSDENITMSELKSTLEKTGKNRFKNNIEFSIESDE